MTYKVVLKVTENNASEEYDTTERQQAASDTFERYYENAWIEEFTKVENDDGSSTMTFYMDSAERWDQYVEDQQPNVGENNVHSNYDYEIVSKIDLGG